jgi:hypothetical protein
MDTKTITTFTPSDLILFHADQFARTGNMLTGSKILNFAERLHVEDVVKAALAAAFLANDKAGYAQLEDRQVSGLFGLTKPHKIFVNPTGSAADWPDGSFEAIVRSYAEKLAPKDNTVNRIVYSWMRSDVSKPWNRALELIEYGMVSRGLLATNVTKVMGIIPHANITLPESTAQRAASQSVEPIKQLLAEYQQTRADLWKRVDAEISSAISSRTDTSSSDNDGKASCAGRSAGRPAQDALPDWRCASPKESL